MKKDILIFLIGLFVFMAPSVSFANYPAHQYVGSFPPPNTLYGSKDAVCAAYVSYRLTVSTVSSVTLNSCIISSPPYGHAIANVTETYNNNNGTVTENRDVGSLFCGDLSPPDAGQCTGTDPNPPPNCIDGRLLETGIYNSKSPPIACIAGCRALRVNKTPPALDCSFGTGVGICYYVNTIDWIDTGVECGQSPDAPPPVPPTTPPVPPPCPVCDCLKAGQSWGTVNGAIVCVPKATPGTPPITTDDPPTTTTTTPAPTPENPNPAPIITITPGGGTTTVTPAPAGSPPGTPPNVTSSTANPDGSKTDIQKPISKFCEDNPNSALCKASKVCEDYPESPMCKFECEKFPELAACQQLGDPSTLPVENLTTQTVDPPTFSPVVVASNNSCPAPISVSLSGHQVTASFDWLCQYAEYFKPLVIAFALAGAAFMVAGAVRSDMQPYQRGLF